MSEIKHAFIYIEVVKKSTDDEMHSAKELAHDYFYTFIKDRFKDKDYFYDSEHNRNTK